MLLRGLLRHCPRCGGGHLFSSWLAMKPQCPTCGMTFEREEGFFLGAFVINFAVVLGLLLAFIAVSIAITSPNPPAGPLAASGAVLTVVVAVAFYPFSRTVWSAVDLIMKPLDAREVAAAEAEVNERR